LGLSTWHFISYAILGAIFQAERELGLRASKMAKLSKGARAELARKYRAVNDTIHFGRPKRDADN
jgi:hypothetical protein